MQPKSNFLYFFFKWKHTEICHSKFSMRNFQRHSDHLKNPFTQLFLFYTYVSLQKISFYFLPTSFQALLWDLVRESTIGSKLNLLYSCSWISKKYLHACLMLSRLPTHYVILTSLSDKVCYKHFLVQKCKLSLNYLQMNRLGGEPRVEIIPMKFLKESLVFSSAGVLWQNRIIF